MTIFKNKVSAVVLFLSLIPILSIGQSIGVTHLEVIKEIANYRSILIENDPESIDRLRDLENKIGGFDNLEENFSSIVANILAAKSSYDNIPVERLLELVDEFCPYCRAKYSMDEETVNLILDHSDLFGLLLEGVLMPNYPFIINGETTILGEVEFYELEANQKIAEIGAGTGIFSILLGVLDKNFEISINELSSNKITFLEKRVDRHDDFLNTELIEVVKGSKSSVKLEKKEYDRIIIRNSYHHFSKEKKMLASIKKALKPGGKLCLFEPVIENIIDKEFACSSTKSRQSILSELNQAGFILEEEDDRYGYLLLRFSVGD